MKDFYGKVAAITGAGAGMGRALAGALAARGCHVAISDVDEAGLAETAAEITGTGVDVSTHVVNVADRNEMEVFAEAVVTEHGRVNLIFNNAGVSVTGTVARMSYEDFQWLMDINFWGVVNGTKAFLPHLEKVDEAHIVNTSSIFGTVAVPTQAAYNASKFAVRGFTYALRAELAGSHIGVSCVQPGGVKTNIVRTSRYIPEDNNAPTREELLGSFERIARLTPRQAAEQILRGVRRGKTQILVGGDARLIALVERLVPTAYVRLLGRLMKNARKQNVSESSPSI